MEEEEGSDCLVPLPNLGFTTGDPDSPSSIDAPIGGRLSMFWRNWETLGLHPWAVKVVKEGLRLSFLQKPRLSIVPIIRSGYRNVQKNKILQDQIVELLGKSAIEVVQDRLSPGFYSRLFLVPKPNDKWRPVIDLSSLNKMLNIPKFKMDTPKVIRSSLEKGQWVFSLDLKDAYLQVPIHQASRKYLRFEFQGNIFQFRVLPFGISTAPWAFTMLVRVVKDILHPLSIPLLQYLDDWLGNAPSYQVATERAHKVVQVCQSLGFLINFEKSELTPKQIFDFVGVHFNLVKGLVFPTHENLVKVCQRAQSFSGLHQASAHQWQSLIGVLGSQDKLVPLGRIHVRPLQIHLHNHWSQGSQSDQLLIPISQESRIVLSWWSQPENLMVGVPLNPPPYTMRMFTDASLQGWGAYCAEETAQGLWSVRETKLHINILEMRAVRKAILAFRPPQGENILVATDNTTVVAYVNNQGGTKSRSLWEETLLLFKELVDRQIFLTARHIPGKMNVLADGLSRQGQIIPTEWMLHPELVKMLFDKWGNATVDLFATKWNRQCQLYVSPVPDSQAWEVDALSLDWNGLVAYAYPPQQILSQVLNKFQETHCCALILVAPLWPRQAWYPSLKKLSQEGPWKIPAWKKMLKQPQSDVYHSNPEVLNLHGWRLLKKH